MLFKIGFTHSPVWRWESSLYGYAGQKKHKWQCMAVLSVAEEPYSAAMLEAALIEKFQGLSERTIHSTCAFAFCSCYTCDCQQKIC